MKLLHYLENIVKGVCLILFVLLTMTLVLMIVSRNLPFITLDVMWTDEISRYIFVYLVFMGSALAMLEGKHIRVDFILNKMPKTMRRIVELLNYTVTGIFCMVMIYGGYMLVKSTTTQAVSTLRKYFVMPMSWWNSSVMISGILMLAAVIISAVRLFRDNDEGKDS